MWITAFFRMASFAVYSDSLKNLQFNVSSSNVIVNVSPNAIALNLIWSTYWAFSLPTASLQISSSFAIKPVHSYVFCPTVKPRSHELSLNLIESSVFSPTRHSECHCTPFNLVRLIELSSYRNQHWLIGQVILCKLGNACCKNRGNWREFK